MRALEDIVVVSCTAGALGIIARLWTGEPWVGALVGLCAAPVVYFAWSRFDSRLQRKLGIRDE